LGKEPDAVLAGVPFLVSATGPHWLHPGSKIHPHTRVEAKVGLSGFLRKRRENFPPKSYLSDSRRSGTFWMIIIERIFTHFPFTLLPLPRLKTGESWMEKILYGLDKPTYICEVKIYHEVLG
jgi:hypothetical protein